MKVEGGAVYLNRAPQEQLDALLATELHTCQAARTAEPAAASTITRVALS